MVAQRTPSVTADVIVLDRPSSIAGPRQTESASLYRRFGKRLMDVVLGAPLAVLLLPLIVAIAGAVVVTSGRPVLYSSERVGLRGRSFRMWKFRTMIRDADEVLRKWQLTNPQLSEEYARNFKVRHDPRITPLGRLLRKFSLDELPQIWNVLCGEMSLVGPRPYFVHELAPHPEVRSLIISVPPGCTGPWQVTGRNSIGPIDRMRYDVDYVLTQNLGRDMVYLVSTVRPLLLRDGL